MEVLKWLLREGKKITTAGEVGGKEGYIVASRSTLFNAAKSRNLELLNWVISVEPELIPKMSNFWQRAMLLQLCAIHGNHLDVLKWDPGNANHGVVCCLSVSSTKVVQFSFKTNKLISQTRFFTE
jgi:hypothetical protein